VLLVETFRAAVVGVLHYKVQHGKMLGCARLSRRYIIKMIKSLEHCSYEERLKELGRESGGGKTLSMHLEYLKGRCKEDGARLFGGAQWQDKR